MKGGGPGEREGKMVGHKKEGMEGAKVKMVSQLCTQRLGEASSNSPVFLLECRDQTLITKCQTPTFKILAVCVCFHAPVSDSKLKLRWKFKLVFINNE